MWEDHVTKTFPRSTVPYILPIIIMPTWCRQHLGPLPLVYPQSSLFCWPLWALYPYGNGDTREDFLNHSNHLITGVSTITRCICTVIYIYICIEFMSRRVFFHEHIPLVWFKPRIDVDFIAFTHTPTHGPGHLSREEREHGSIWQHG